MSLRLALCRAVPCRPCSVVRPVQQCMGFRDHCDLQARLGAGVSESHTQLPPPPQASLVHTTETTRIRYFMDLLMEKSWPVMLVGNAGSGKSVLMGDKLESLDPDDYLVQAVPFNFYTTSAMLQGEARSALCPSRQGPPCRAVAPS